VGGPRSDVFGSVPFFVAPFCSQLEGLPAMVQAVRSDDPAVQLEATTQFRKLLSIGEIWIVVGAAATCLGCMPR
jgi:hypothetical protein